MRPGRDREKGTVDGPSVDDLLCLHLVTQITLCCITMNREDEREHLCGLYVRVSTDRQAAVEDGSLDAQICRLKD